MSIDYSTTIHVALTGSLQMTLRVVRRGEYTILIMVIYATFMHSGPAGPNQGRSSQMEKNNDVVF